MGAVADAERPACAGLSFSAINDLPDDFIVPGTPAPDADALNAAALDATADAVRRAVGQPPHAVALAAITAWVSARTAQDVAIYGGLERALKAAPATPSARTRGVATSILPELGAAVAASALPLDRPLNAWSADHMATFLATAADLIAAAESAACEAMGPPF